MEKKACFKGDFRGSAINAFANLLYPLFLCLPSVFAYAYYAYLRNAYATSQNELPGYGKYSQYYYDNYSIVESGTMHFIGLCILLLISFICLLIACICLIEAFSHLLYKWRGVYVVDGQSGRISTTTFEFVNSKFQSECCCDQMDSISVSQSFVERLCGVGCVTIHYTRFANALANQEEVTFVCVRDPQAVTARISELMPTERRAMEVAMK